MKVLRIPLRRLRNEEWFELLSIFLQKVLQIGAGSIGLAALITRFTPLFKHADKLLKVLHKSLYTADMETADKKRGDILQGLYAVVKGSQKQPDEAKRRAATQLFNVLKIYRKSTTRGGYAEETGTVRNLLQDLQEKYAAEVALLGLGEWVTALSAAEQEFLEHLSEREKENIAKPKGNLVEARRQVDAIYLAAINVLDAQLVADGLDSVEEPEEEEDDEDEGGDGPVEGRDTPGDAPQGNATYDFVVSWNETLKSYQTLLNRRDGLRSKKEEDPEDDSPVEG
ncbi:MAG: DUF6261 family protein [Tannerellaceae bacterium]|jgi:hypothetical protein|nr:DUF6261 family protein [Tannerellaceae bacterium]